MTEFGRLVVGTREELFERAVALAAGGRTGDVPFDIALSGGATPKDWFRWCAARKGLPPALARAGRFSVSDERCVPLHSEQSNFGQADRLFLSPLRVPPEQKQPWPVHLLPHEAAETYAASRKDRLGRVAAYDVCFLGMGEDGHMASIFPDSPLLADRSGRFFAAVEVPGRGWRLTVTPTGLAACRLIVVMVLGASKAAMLRAVFTGPSEPQRKPVQLLREWRERVVWLTDQTIS